MGGTKHLRNRKLKGGSNERIFDIHRKNTDTAWGFKLVRDGYYIIVTEVEPGSPAALVGLKPYEKISRIILRDSATGFDFTSDFTTTGETVMNEINIKKWVTIVTFNPVPIDKITITRNDITNKWGFKLRRGEQVTPRAEGMLITNVLDNSPAALAGLKKNMIIKMIGINVVYSYTPATDLNILSDPTAEGKELVLGVGKELYTGTAADTGVVGTAAAAAITTAADNETDVVGTAAAEEHSTPAPTLQSPSTATHSTGRANSARRSGQGLTEDDITDGTLAYELSKEPYSLDAAVTTAAAGVNNDNEFDIVTGLLSGKIIEMDRSGGQKLGFKLRGGREGAVITEVDPGGQADKKKLKVGMVITHINGHDVRNEKTRAAVHVVEQGNTTKLKIAA